MMWQRPTVNRRISKQVSAGPFGMNELSKMERNNHGLLPTDAVRETGQSENSNVYHSSTAQISNTVPSTSNSSSARRYFRQLVMAVNDPRPMRHLADARTLSNSYRGRASRQWLTDYATGSRGEAGISYIG
ncbi:hypothetical protein CBL_01422 [Carabus blaptoides fortunei]